ncbi:MAG: transglutaminase domain-containing protein [Candidatus Omnitrophota bacterium]|jgi:tetratricopeptide (TPR) repeat protein
MSTGYTLADAINEEYWGNIFFENKKTGYFNYRILPREDKEGHEVRILSYDYPTADAPDSKKTGEIIVFVNKDLSLDHLELKNHEYEGELYAEARATKEGIAIDITRNGYVTHCKVSTNSKVYPSVILMKLVADRNLGVGSYEFDVFEEDFLEVIKEKLTVVRKFESPIGGKQKVFFEIAVSSKTFDNLNQRFIIDEDGKLISGQYENINVLYKVIPESEVEKDAILPASKRSSIPVATYMVDLNKLYYLKVKGRSFTLIRNNLILRSPRQKVSFINNNYEVIVENNIKIPDRIFKIGRENTNKYLADSVYAEINDNAIRSLALEIAGADENIITKVTKISKWINGEIKFTEKKGFYSARDVLKIKEGDCSEYAVLFCALCRSLGIPAKGVLGISYGHGYFGYHMWNEIYDNGTWLPVDVTVNQIGFVDAGHIKFSDTDLSFKALALYNYQMLGSCYFDRFEVLDYKGTAGMTFEELSKLPRPNLRKYPEAVLPVISPEDIIIKDPMRIGISYFDVGSLAEEHQPINIGLQRVFRRNLMCIRKFSILDYYSEPGEKNCFLKNGKELTAACEKRGVEYLLIGRVSQESSDNNSLILSVSIFDKKRNATIVLDEIKCRKDVFLKASQKMIFQIVKNLEVSISDLERRRIEEFYLPDFSCFLLYSKGAYQGENISKRNVTSFFEGLIYLRLALKKDPNFSLAYKELANFFPAGRIDTADYMYDAALKLDPFDADCYWDKYMALIGSNKNDRKIYDETKVLLEKALNIAPYFALAHLSLGSRYSHNHEYDKALKETLKAQTLSPKSPAVYYNLAVIYGNKKMFKEAEQSYLKCLELDNKYTDAYVWLNELYFDVNEVDKALQLLKKGLEIMPDSPELRVEICRVFYKKDNIEQVIDNAKKALELDEDIGRAHYFLGLAYKKKDKVDDAIREFKLEESINPEYHYTYERLGFLFDKKDDFKQAIFYYKKAIEYGSTLGCAYNNLAWDSIIENSERDKTIYWAKKGVELGPEDHDHLGTLGWAYYENGKYDEAIEIFQKVLGKGKFKATDALGLSVSYLRKNDKKKALEILRKAFDKDKGLNKKEIFKQEESFITSNLDIEIKDIIKSSKENKE